jgi:predicted SAM-dependent methyltransferase
VAHAYYIYGQAPNELQSTGKNSPGRVKGRNKVLRILKAVYHFWYRSAAINSARDLFWRTAVACAPGLWPSKLHLGCGDRHYDGYLNIDIRKTHATDMVCDIRTLPFRSGSVDLIENYHVIEHMGRHDLPPALSSWHRVLKPGGRLIMECPDFDEDVKGYLSGDDSFLDHIFGLQRYATDFHYFGYNVRRLKELLENCGFTSVISEPARDPHSTLAPCLRVTCTKP